MLDAQRPLRGIRQRLSQLRMPELRNVLTDLNLQRAGRKAELVDRIAATLEAMDRKASDSGAGNAAMASFYRDQLKSALRSVERQMAPPAPPVSASRPVGVDDQLIPLGSYSSPPVSRYASQAPPVRRDIPPFQANGRYAGQHPGYHGQQGRAPTQYAAAVQGVASQPGGADLYSPRNVGELAGARCFCGVGGVSGKLIGCVKCALQVHAKCHQLITHSGEWYCEACRAQTYDPFYTVKKTILPATFVRFVRSSSILRLEYMLADDDLSKLYAGRDPKPGSMTPGSLELQLRCFALKDELSTGTCWPTTTQLYVNSFGVPVTQRAPPGSTNPSKVLRELPANIFQFSRAGRNVVELRTADNPALFAFEIQIVEVRNVNTMVAEIKEASENITYESAKKQVIASFGGDADDDDDDGIEATCTMLSIRCPLGLCVIDLPARGRYCKHLQCFDLKTFLLFNRKARSKAWRCTVCHNFIKASDLRIDPYLKRLLTEVAGEEELEEVEIFPDGSWKRRVGDEVPAPAAKRVKTEQGDGSISSGATVNPEAATLEVSAGTSAGSSSAPVEIDLLSSDDDDDDDDAPLTSSGTNSTATSAAVSTPAAALTAPAAPVAPVAPIAPAPPVSTAGSQPILLDDDLGILTVGSDAWETPPSTSAHGGAADDTYFNFPLDDPLFGGSTSSAASSTTSNWNTSITTTTTVSPPEELLNESEVSLANAMADLSRVHPNVSNPFERRRPTPSAVISSASQLARNSRPSQQQPDPLDIIYLLDSDSD